MKAFTVAAVQIAPVQGPLTAESVKGNLAKAAEWVERCVDATGAELVVLPESVTTGFTPGIAPEELWDLVSRSRDRSSSRCRRSRRRLGVHVVAGSYERGPERGHRLQRRRLDRPRRQRSRAAIARPTRSAPRCCPGAAG